VVSPWCGVAQLWCGVAQLVARRLAVRQARVQISAQHHREVFPTEHRSDEEMERGLSEWGRINVLYECDCMNVYHKNMKNKQKEWHHATKHLKKSITTVRDQYLSYATFATPLLFHNPLHLIVQTSEVAWGGRFHSNHAVKTTFTLQ
jgi:hypothetical protein